MRFGRKISLMHIKILDFWLLMVSIVVSLLFLNVFAHVLCELMFGNAGGKKISFFFLLLVCLGDT